MNIKHIIDQIKHYISYFARAKSAYQIEDKHVRDIILRMVESSPHHPDLDLIEQARKEMKADNTLLTFVEHGAGSKNLTGSQRKVSDVAATSLSQPNQCAQIYRLAQQLRPQNTIELGTSLGLMSYGIALGHKQGNIYTIEGNDDTAAYARGVHQKANIDNVEVINDVFDNCLTDLLKKLGTLDLAIIDGNHTYEATIRYFDQMRSYATESTVLVFDDIYWSSGMQKAWQKIKGHDQVSCTIDLYDIGVVFLEKNKPPTHYTIIPHRKKPWKKKKT